MISQFYVVYPLPTLPWGEAIGNPALSDRLKRQLFIWGGAGFLSRFISNLVTIFLIAAAVVAFFFLVIGGIRYMTSGGDREATEAAQGQITKAIIGLVLVFVAYAIIILIGNMLGISLVQINLKPLMLR